MFVALGLLITVETLQGECLYLLDDGVEAVGEGFWILIELIGFVVDDLEIFVEESVRHIGWFVFPDLGEVVEGLEEDVAIAFGSLTYVGVVEEVNADVLNALLDFVFVEEFAGGHAAEPHLDVAPDVPAIDHAVVEVFGEGKEGVFGVGVLG